MANDDLLRSMEAQQLLSTPGPTRPTITPRLTSAQTSLGGQFGLFQPTPIVGGGPITPPSEDPNFDPEQPVGSFDDLDPPNTVGQGPIGLEAPDTPPVLIGSGGTLPFELTEPIGTNIGPGLTPPPGATLPTGSLPDAPPPPAPPATPAPSDDPPPRDLSTSAPAPSLLGRLNRIRRRSLLGRP